MPDKMLELINECKADLEKMEWYKNNAEKLSDEVDYFFEMKKMAKSLEEKANKIYILLEETP